MELMCTCFLCVIFLFVMTTSDARLLRTEWNNVPLERLTMLKNDETGLERDKRQTNTDGKSDKACRCSPGCGPYELCAVLSHHKGRGRCVCITMGHDTQRKKRSLFGIAAKKQDEPCGYDEFECARGDQCIPLAYQCDQEIDCLDRSDEIGCSAPVITVPPGNELEVELGGQFSIFCKAVGVPTPLIVWRLNRGNIPTGNRVRVKSQGGRGTLTIADVRYTDAGAYTCEAINNSGSIFAIPDTLVIVRR